MQIQTAKEIAEAHTNWLTYVYLKQKYGESVDSAPILTGGGGQCSQNFLVVLVAR